MSNEVTSASTFRIRYEAEVRQAPSLSSTKFYTAQPGRLVTQLGPAVKLPDGKQRVPLVPRGWVDAAALECVEDAPATSGTKAWDQNGGGQPNPAERHESNAWQNNLTVSASRWRKNGNRSSCESTDCNTSCSDFSSHADGRDRTSNHNQMSPPSNRKGSQVCAAARDTPEDTRSSAAVPRSPGSISDSEARISNGLSPGGRSSAAQSFDISGAEEIEEEYSADWLAVGNDIAAKTVDQCDQNISLTASPAVETPGSEESYVGRLKAFSQRPDGERVGWISCAKTQQLYGADVYAHASNLDGLDVGDTVRFSVHVNAKGQPQVCNGSVSKFQSDSPFTADLRRPTSSGVLASERACRGAIDATKHAPGRLVPLMTPGT